jgi:hypothetical protein
METQTVELDNGVKEERLVVYTITTLYVRKIKDEVKREVLCESCDHGRTTTPGWYSSLERAKKCVESGWGSLDDGGYYNYLIIERVVEGLYNLSGLDLDKETSWWYKFDYKEDEWVPCEKPKIFHQVSGFWM